MDKPVDRTIRYQYFFDTDIRLDRNSVSADKKEVMINRFRIVSPNHRKRSKPMGIRQRGEKHDKMIPARNSLFLWGVKPDELGNRPFIII
jgi:hypothetical protein